MKIRLLPTKKTSATSFASGGAHVLSVEARDRAGNVTSCGSHTLNVKAYALYLPVIRR